jgi:TolA-binding protein
MDIVLLVAVVAVAVSGLYVAAALKLRAKDTTTPLINRAVMQINGKIEAAVNSQRQVLQDGLAQGRELEGRRWGNAQDQFRQMAGVISEVKRQTGKTQEQVDQIVDRVEGIARQLAAVELRKAGLARVNTSSGEIPVNEVTDATHPLALAVLESESNRARDGWGKPPQLYALAAKASLIETAPDLADQIDAARKGSLIPIKQEPLPPGEPLEVLAGVHWPDDVIGCVLVTELVVLPPETEGVAPRDPEELEQWAGREPGGQPARLAVGVSRNGDYACILRLKGDDSVQFDPGLADDLVTALLETL